MPKLGSIFVSLINTKNGKKYPLVYDDDRLFTTVNNIPAGNYYIAVHEYILGEYDRHRLGGYYQFRWY